MARKSDPTKEPGTESRVGPKSSSHSIRAILPAKAQYLGGLLVFA